MSQVKERPILFSAPMVRAILEGRKTVTRRALNAQALKNIGYGVQLGECHELPSEGPLHPNSIGYYTDFCPFGQLGDRLWVRETWYCDHVSVQKGPYLQPADMHDLDQCREDGELVYAADGLAPYEQEQPTWKPSIHMPRWASRIRLEITDVRVERLQDITEEQALAEGIGTQATESFRATGVERPAGFAFRDLWASTGGEWESNPWVWVVDFKRVTP